MSVVGYAPGDTIELISTPFIKTRKRNPVRMRGYVGVSDHVEICDGCFLTCVDGVKCHNCGLMTYCTVLCQNLDWKNGHGIECGSKTFDNSVLSNMKCHLLRTMCFFVMNPGEDERKFKTYIDEWRCFQDLMSHFEEWSSSEDDLTLTNLCQSLAKEIAEEGLNTGTIVADKNYFIKLAGIFITNGFTIYNEAETKEIGSGIFVESSIFNHSCKPTATFSCRGTSLEVRAITEIQKGEEPTISYISGNMCKERRRKMLKERYHFTCECERCASDEEENIDFNKLNGMIDFVSGCTLESMQEILEPNDETVNRILDIHTKIIDIMSQIYHEYDTRVTSQYSRTISALINSTARNPIVLLNSSRINELIENTKRQLQITTGIDHPEYVNFIKLLEKNQTN